MKNNFYKHLLISLALFSALASYADKEVVNNVKYNYKIVDGVAVIKGADVGSLAEVIIPDTLGNASVRTIDRKAFSGCDSIATIVIPEGITSIEAKAFAG